MASGGANHVVCVLPLVGEIRDSGGQRESGGEAGAGRVLDKTAIKTVA